MSDLEKAKQLLIEGDYTCVFCQGDDVVSCTERGVKPLVALYESDRTLQGFSAADKVVGRGAAFLYLMLNVKEVYAGVISQAALSILTQYGVTTTYGTLVAYIRNRRGDGMCPFEEAVLNVQNKEEAYRVISQKLKMMGK